MWADDKYWVNLVLEGKKFDADFFLDENNENVVKYQIREKKEVLRTVLPIIIVLAVIAVLVYGILSSGILNQPAKKAAVFLPSTSAKSTMVSTTAATTTATTTIASPQIIPPPPVPQTVLSNKTYIYYIYYSGSPPQSQTYFAVANGSGVSNWKLLVGSPVDLSNADCSVYSFYTYCTSAVNLTTSTSSTTNSMAAKTQQNSVRIGNPVCLALHPPDPSICYNTYYNTTQ
jgi:hypothetical protein